MVSGDPDVGIEISLDDAELASNVACSTLVLESSRNPQLDPRRIAGYEAFQARMKDAGVEVRTRYLVAPALRPLVTLMQRR